MRVNFNISQACTNVMKKLEDRRSKEKLVRLTEDVVAEVFTVTVDDQHGFLPGDQVILGGVVGSAHDGELLMVCSVDGQELTFETPLMNGHDRGTLLCLGSRSLYKKCGRTGPHTCTRFLVQDSEREHHMFRVRGEHFGALTDDDKLFMHLTPLLDRTFFLVLLRCPWVKDVTMWSCACARCAETKWLCVFLSMMMFSNNVLRC